jgi:glycine betaine/proline transport system substrate-binding protein
MLAPARTANADGCELDRPVRIAGLDWDSNRFHAAVAAFILEHGYGCKTEILPGTTIPLLTGLGRGDLDIMMEVWKEQLTEAWEKAEKSGKVKLLGVNYPDAVQGWFVPRYLVEGENAPAKGLRSVADLPRYKTLFRDPEEPDKGRFYNCKLGWDCETINTKKLAAYGLNDHYVNFRTGSGAALSAAIASAYRRKKPILYYYWGPTWVMAKYDAVQLKEPEYDADVWARMKSTDRPAQATAYPEVTVYTGANTEFVKQAPRLVAFLNRYRTSNKIVSEALLYLQEKPSAGDPGAARHFLRTREDIWSQWVPGGVAERIRAALQ